MQQCLRAACGGGSEEGAEGPPACSAGEQAGGAATRRHGGGGLPGARAVSPTALAPWDLAQRLIRSPVHACTNSFI